MATIQGANNPANRAHVDGQGRLKTRSTQLPEAIQAGIEENAFNLNTGNIVLTNTAESGLFYLRNGGEERDLIVSRLFFYTTESTGGSGQIDFRVVFNPTSGTLLTASDLTPSNLNAGSGKILSVTAKLGAQGLTVGGGTTPFRTLVPSTPATRVISLEPAIVLPRGSSMAFLVTPQTGNTNLTIQSGVNYYLAAV